MKKIARKSVYILFLILLVSSMLLMFSGTLYANEVTNGTNVTVTKIVDNVDNDPTLFPITITGPGGPYTGNISESGLALGFSLPEGTFTISEGIVTDYSLISIDPGDTREDLDGSQFYVGSQEAVPITITNTFTGDDEDGVTGRVCVTKVVDNIADDPTSFGIEITGEASAILAVEQVELIPIVLTGSISETGSPVCFDLEPGVYTLSEVNIPAGYSLVGIEGNATDLDPSDVNFTFEVGIESEINFIITNTGPNGGVTPTPTITVQAITEKTTIEVAAVEEETVEVAPVVEVAAIQELPRTGNNNMLFYVIGFALMAIGVAFGSFFISKNLRKREN